METDYSNYRDELYFKRNQMNNRDEAYLRLDFDSLGHLIDAFKIFCDTNYVEDPETGETIQVISQWNEPVDELFIFEPDWV